MIMIHKKQIAQQAIIHWTENLLLCYDADDHLDCDLRQIKHGDRWCVFCQTFFRGRWECCDPCPLMLIGKGCEQMGTVYDDFCDAYNDIQDHYNFSEEAYQKLISTCEAYLLVIEEACEYMMTAEYDKELIKLRNQMP